MSEILKSVGLEMPTVSGTLYTAPAAVTVIVLSGKIFSAAATTLDLSVTKTLGGSTVMVTGLSLEAGETYTFPTKLVLESGDILVGTCSVAGATLFMSYVEHGNETVSVSAATTAALAAAASAVEASDSEDSAAASAAIALANANELVSDLTPQLGGPLDGQGFSISNAIEKVYTLTGSALDPENGSIQTKTITADTTLTDSLVDGESMSLVLTDASSYSITWPSMTWFSSEGNVTPEALTALDLIVFWKIGTTLYGRYAGSAV